LNGDIIVHNAATSRWIRFRNPHRILIARQIEEVLPALEESEKLVEENQWYAAGYIGYEAARSFDAALSTRPAAGLPLLWFGLYSQPEEIDLPNPDFGAYTLGEASVSVSRTEYERAIRRIKKYIGRGDTYQVNYTLRLRIPFSGDPWHLFLAMVRAQSPGYSAWVDAGDFSICSASPELFFRLEGDQLTCKPMKGTVKRGRTLNEDRSFAEWLQLSEKNRAENLMIVDMIRNDLGRVAETGTVQVPHLFEVERHPTLWQMTSTVTAHCTKPVSEIMRALFPCASITGAPKVRTTEIISEIESTPRGLYTGCIGFYSPGRSAQFNVAIRTAVVDRKIGLGEYGSGGGIVWDSAPGDEYTEALLKARVLTEQRPAFSLLETMLWTPEEGYFLLENHLRRLLDSAEYFGYAAYPETIRRLLEQQASGFSAGRQRVRLLIGADGDVAIEAAPLPEDTAEPLRLGVAREPVNSSDMFLYNKTTRRQVYEAARESVPDCDDVLLYNERGELTESTIANLVLEIDGNLVTPPVASGLLPGTYREILLGQATIREQVLHFDDLRRCSKIYLINSVRKWREAVLCALGSI
jgi:para-aminobenzoate synthetase / 4-amino-4-deoxychorismate lyase